MRKEKKKKEKRKKEKKRRIEDVGINRKIPSL